jgi:hypothetical protein
VERRECKRQAHIEIWATWILCILGCDIVGFGNFFLTDCCQVGSQLCWLHGFILCSNFDATFASSPISPSIPQPLFCETTNQARLEFLKAGETR